MAEKITRRDFIGKTALIGLGAILASKLELSPHAVASGIFPEREPRPFQFYPSPLRRSGTKEWFDWERGEPDGLGYKVYEPFLSSYVNRGERNSSWGFIRSSEFDIDELTKGQLFENALVIARHGEDGNYALNELPVNQVLSEQGYDHWISENFASGGKDSAKIWQLAMATHFMVPPHAFVPEAESELDRPFPTQIEGKQITIYNLGAKHGVVSHALEELDEYLASQGVEHVNLITTDFQDELPFNNPIIRQVKEVLYARKVVYEPLGTELSFDAYMNLEVPPPERLEPPHAPGTEQFKRSIDLTFNDLLLGLVGNWVAIRKAPSEEFPPSFGIETDEFQKWLEFYHKMEPRDFPALRIMPPLVPYKT